MYLSLLLSTACVREPATTVTLKVFNLTPEEWTQNLSRFEATAGESGGAGVWFWAEDETGRIRVSTEKLPWQVNCPPGTRFSAEGRVNMTPAGAFFSATRILGCSTPPLHFAELISSEKSRPPPP